MKTIGSTRLQPRTLATCLAVLTFAICAKGRAEPLSQIVEARLRDSDVPACVAVSRIAERVEREFRCHPKADQTLDDETLFEIGSISKALTGLLLADFVSRGELRLTDTAASLSRKGAKLPKGGREIVLRDLVSHTSGLPPMPPVLNAKDWRDPYAGFDADALYAALASTNLDAEPGSVYRYSNFAFMLLSEILERAGGKPFDELLKERVFEPLGMTSATVRPSPAHEKRLAIGHEGDYAAVPRRMIPAAIAGSGGVYASLKDLELLASALAGRRKTPLDPVIELALSPLAPIGDRGTVGYGWNVWRLGSSRIREHSGGTSGFSASVLADPSTKSAAVVLADSSVGLWDLAAHLIKTEYPLRRPQPSARFELAENREFIGRYEMTSGQVISIFKDGVRLRACCTSDARSVELMKVSKDRAVIRGLDAPFNFVRDAENRVSGFSVFSAGGYLSAMRIPD